MSALAFLLTATCVQTRLSDQGTADMQAKLAPLAQRYGVAFTFPTEELRAGATSYTYSPVIKENEARATAFVAMFVQEFAKYPADFIKASKLKRVLFVENLAVGAQRRAAVPAYDTEDLLYDVTYIGNDRYVRHVVHHEFYHMLEQEWNGSAYYKDPKWAALNAPDFKYGAGGENAYGKGDVWSFVHPKPGFINVYSTYGLEEDKAEVWAVMFVPANWKLVAPLVEEDAILRAKVGYLREFGRTKSPSMGEEFWKSLTTST